MKKSLVALAALAATAAFAQSSVTLYGVADAFVGSSKTAGGSAQTVIESGGLSGSRVGVSVKEDLGSGLNGFVVLEAGANIDTGTGVSARKSVLGLSGSFGAVSLGMQDNALFDAVDGLLDAQGTDKFSAVLSAAAGSAIGAGGTAAGLIGFTDTNSVRYDTPNFDGFSGAVQLGLGENKAAKRATRDTSFHVKYINGPLGVGLAHGINENPGNNVVSTGYLGGKQTTTGFGGFYDFGAAKLNLGLYNTKPNGGNNTRGYNIGVTAPIGAFTVIGQVAQFKTKNVAGNNRAVGLEGRYALSKRTTTYVGINNTKNTAKQSSRLVGVGVRHVF